MKEAPLFVHTYDFHGWLLDRLTGAGGYRPIRRAVLGHSQGLLEAVSLALTHFDTEQCLVDADQHVVLLRVHLRLAGEKHLLSQRQVFYCTERLREIGRQIGGWRRSLHRGEDA